MMKLNDLEKISGVVIHFVLANEIMIDFSSLEMVVSEGSVADIKTDKDLFAVIASAMQFPDYFGNNWDALDECLSDMDWLPADGYLLVLHEATKGWSRNPYVLGRFVTAWLEAAEYWIENQTPFHLVFIM
jgi:RNAse (barnase) inhibitor barstar